MRPLLALLVLLVLTACGRKAPLEVPPGPEEDRASAAATTS